MARRRAGLQAAQFKAHRAKAGGQAPRGTFAHAAALGLRFPGVHQGAEKCAGGHNAARHASSRPSSSTTPVIRILGVEFWLLASGFHNEAINNAFHNVEIRHTRQQRLHLGRILVLIRLRPRRLHRRPLAAVKHAKLNPRRINRQAHQPAQRINFPNHLPLGQPANGRVAAHAANGQRVHGDHRHAPPVAQHVRRRPRGLGPRVPAADDENVEIFMVVIHGHTYNQPLFSRALCARTSHLDCGHSS